jgi:hypothetical protein
MYDKKVFMIVPLAAVPRLKAVRQQKRVLAAFFQTAFSSFLAVSFFVSVKAHHLLAYSHSFLILIFATAASYFFSGFQMYERIYAPYMVYRLPGFFHSFIN